MTEALEVLYPWHPWFGRAVYIHEVIERGGEQSFRCDLAKSQTARCMDVPAWMVDRAACTRIGSRIRPNGLQVTTRSASASKNTGEQRVTILDRAAVLPALAVRSPGRALRCRSCLSEAAVQAQQQEVQLDDPEFSRDGIVHRGD